MKGLTALWELVQLYLLDWQIGRHLTYLEQQEIKKAQWEEKRYGC
jgi:hypothetical protein